MARPRLLIIPNFTEVEWNLRERLEEWADVAFLEKAIGGDEEVAERAAAELESRGWPSAVVVSDEWAVLSTMAVAKHRPELIEALVLGHACLGLITEGERPALRAAVTDGYQQVLLTDYRTFARVLTQVTQGAFSEERAAEFIARVPHKEALTMVQRMEEKRGVDFEPVLRSLDVPMLLVKHKGCLLWTDEGFEDVCAAFPDARSASLEQKPSVSPDFADLLRDFCTTAARSPAATA